MIEDQTKCHRNLIQHHAILHQKDSGMQHPFQLCQQRNLFCSLCTCDYVVRNDGDSKKKEVLPPFVSMNALLFSMQYGYASFPCVLQPKSIPEAGKSLIVHIKTALITKFCFPDIS